MHATHTTLPSVHATHTTLPSVRAIHTTLPSVHVTHTTLPSVHVTHTTLPSVRATHTTLPSVHVTHTTLPWASQVTPMLGAWPLSFRTPLPLHGLESRERSGSRSCRAETGQGEGGRVEGKKGGGGGRRGLGGWSTMKSVAHSPTGT